MSTRPGTNPFVRRTLTALVAVPVTVTLAATLVACGDGDDGDADDPDATTTVTATPSAGDDGPTDDGGDDGAGSGAGGDQGRAGRTGSLLAAAQTALGEVGGATVTSVDDDPAGWEVSLVGGSGGEQEVVVSGDGSRVVDGPRPDDDVDPGDVSEEQALVRSAQVDYAAAVDAATAEVSGDVVGVDLDGDAGTTTWQVSIRQGATEQEVTVDAASGDVLGTEQDD